MSTVALNPAPFTELRLTISNKKDKTYMTDIASYLMNEVFKNEELPYLPREMWDYILTFIPIVYRTDAIFIGNTYVYKCYKYRTQSTSIETRTNVPRSKEYFSDVKEVSFKSDRNNAIIINSIYIKDDIKSLVEMDDYVITELIKILDAAPLPTNLSFQEWFDRGVLNNTISSIYRKRFDQLRPNITANNTISLYYA